MSCAIFVLGVLLLVMVAPGLGHALVALAMFSLALATILSALYVLHQYAMMPLYNLWCYLRHGLRALYKETPVDVPFVKCAGQAVPFVWGVIIFGSLMILSFAPWREMFPTIGPPDLLPVRVFFGASFFASLIVAFVHLLALLTLGERRKLGWTCMLKSYHEAQAEALFCMCAFPRDCWEAPAMEPPQEDTSDKEPPQEDTPVNYN